MTAANVSHRRSVQTFDYGSTFRFLDGLTCVPALEEEPFHWDASSFVERPRLRKVPPHMFSGEDPWLAWLKAKAASLGVSWLVHLLCWCADDTGLKTFSPATGQEYRIAYLLDWLLKVEPSPLPPFGLGPRDCGRVRN